MATVTIALSVDDAGEHSVRIELPKRDSGDAGRAARRSAKKMLMALAKDQMKHADDFKLLKRIFATEVK